jgi:hypothetical protein
MMRADDMLAALPLGEDDKWVVFSRGPDGEFQMELKEVRDRWGSATVGAVITLDQEEMSRLVTMIDGAMHNFWERGAYPTPSYRMIEGSAPVGAVIK